MVLLRHHFGMAKMLAGTTVIAAALSCCGCHARTDWGPPRGVGVVPGDVVVIGRLKNLNSELGIYDPDDLLGHGWFVAKFRVSHVQQGTLAKSVVQVRYFGHTWLREDIKFRFRLRPAEGGYYFICAPLRSSGYNCDAQAGS